MIYKSYLIEENIDLLKNNIALFYGENLGLINEFKEILKLRKDSKNILKFNQDNIIKNQSLIFNEIKNISLFEKKKIIFIDDVNDKILKVIQEIIPEIGDNEIYLFGNVLEKKSKLRDLLEKSKDCDVVACYKDNEINIKKLIINKLKSFSGVTPQVINILAENSNQDRVKINNELNKIKTYFIDKKIEITQLEELINQKIDEDFNFVKDTALKGNNNKTNELLNSTVFEIENIPLYINIINQRLNRLKEVANSSKKKDLSIVINLLKPPIFWKDKPNFIEQAKIWDQKKLKNALKKTYDLEIKIKTNSAINKSVLVKKLLLDMCILANS